MNKNAVGEEMWINQFCGMKLTYYDESETHEGTSKEIETARNPYLEKQREYRRECKEKKEKRVEHIVKNKKQDRNLFFSLLRHFCICLNF